MNFIKLTFDPLSVEEATNLVSDVSCGAVSVFIGTTRNNFEGKHVTRLEYEAYDEMAKKEMLKICEKCREKWNVKKIAVHHRLGVVNVKEASVIIAVSSEHRQESLDAVTFLINTLKATVPIWKKEVYSDEDSEWKENKECSWKNDKTASTENGNERKCFDEDRQDLDSYRGKDEEIHSVTLENKTTICEEHNHQFYNEKLNRNFVQIVVPKTEIDRRINSFIERKRNEVNALNNELFHVKTLNDGVCARTSANICRSLGFNSHIPVVKIANETGPQTMNTSLGFSTNFLDTSPRKDNFSRRGFSSGKSFELRNIPGIEERLFNLEEHLNMREEETSDSSIFSRINALEKRVLFLEGLSPEYFKNININIFKKRKKLDNENKFKAPRRVFENEFEDEEVEEDEEEKLYTYDELYK